MLPIITLKKTCLCRNVLNFLGACELLCSLYCIQGLCSANLLHMAVHQIWRSLLLLPHHGHLLQKSPGREGKGSVLRLCYR